MNGYNYSVRSAWPGQVESPAAIGERFLSTLDDLSRIDPIFSDWSLTDFVKLTGIPLAQARKTITAIVENNVDRDDSDDPDPGSGYRMSAYNDSRPKARLTPKTMHVSVGAGSQRNSENGAKLEAGDIGIPPDLSIVTYPIFKAALLAIISNWPCRWADAYAFKMDYWKASAAPGVPPVPYSLFHMAWIAYLSAPLAEGLVPPHGILTQRTPNGGLLMIATEERLDPTNPEHMRRSKTIAEIMIERTGERSLRSQRT